MIDARVLDEISDSLNRYIPDSLKTVKGDVEANMRSAVQGAFERMDLVTREDYDVQVAMVAKLRVRLEELDARVQAMEAKQGATE